MIEKLSLCAKRKVVTADEHSHMRLKATYLRSRHSPDERSMHRSRGACSKTDGDDEVIQNAS